MSKASESSGMVSCSLPLMLLVKPRRSWDRMTPEFPLAPRREPLETALHSAVMSAFSPNADTSLAADMMVMVILVPVSPSGTGNTFNSLIHSFLLSRFFAPAKNILDNILASIVFEVTISPPILNSATAVSENRFFLQAAGSRHICRCGFQSITLTPSTKMLIFSIWMPVNSSTLYFTLLIRLSDTAMMLTP